MRLPLTLRPPISTSVHHLVSGNCDAQLLSEKNRISRPACTLLGASARAAPVSPSRSGTGRQPFPQVSPGLPPHDFSPAPCQGTQSLDLCSTLPVSGSFLCPIALLQALCDPPAGLPRRACSLGVGVRFPVAGRRRTASPEGSDRRQAPCVSAANVVSCEQPPPPCASCIARCSCPRTSPASPHSPPLSSARHLLPLALSRCRGLKTVDFWGRRKVRPRALPQPRPLSPFEQPYGHCG